MSPDPILIEILKSQFGAVADEMGVTLGRTAFSPNIKERRDYSCAVFDPCGDMVAQAAHIPVHLGAMPLSVQACLKRFTKLEDGDIAVLNDPFAGGSHLPDITMVSPVYFDETLLGYVANRAHHADVGGMTPGSMPLARELFQEGLIIPPVKLQRCGDGTAAVLDEAVLDLIARNSRTPAERLGDLSAQIAAQRVGIRRLQALAERHGTETVSAYMLHLQDYAETLMRALLAQIPAGTYTFEDVLDDDGFGHINLPIRVAIRTSPLPLSSKERGLVIDFTGTAPQTEGGVNAVYAVTLSAVFYVLRCLLDDDAVPTNAGIFRPVEVIAPEGTLVNARFPASVAAGNVETSQRITDVLLGAFAQALPGRVPAASQGTMNNLTIGGETEKGRFAYYETIAGGMGASASADGLSGVHVHMTNTLNTPCEALEYAYPLRVTRYHLRRGSGGDGGHRGGDGGHRGGDGGHRGGDGLYREIELLADATVTILSERRTHAPYGLSGGENGKCGENFHIVEGERRQLPGKITFRARCGDRIGIATPGGGGFGEASQTLHPK